MEKGLARFGAVLAILIVAAIPLALCGLAMTAFINNVWGVDPGFWPTFGAMYFLSFVANTNRIDFAE